MSLKRRLWSVSKLWAKRHLTNCEDSLEVLDGFRWWICKFRRGSQRFKLPRSPMNLMSWPWRHRMYPSCDLVTWPSSQLLSQHTGRLMILLWSYGLSFMFMNCTISCPVYAEFGEVEVNGPSLGILLGALKLWTVG